MRWLRWFGLWTLLGLVASAQLFFANQRLAAVPYTWWQALKAGLPGWWLWALLSPVVVWLARRFRVDRANFGRHFVIHLGASLDLALLQVIAAVGIQAGLHALRGEPYPFAQRLVDAFTLFYHWSVLIYWTIVAVVHALDYHHALEERRRHAAELEARLQAVHALVGEAEGEPAGRRPAERVLVMDDGRSFFVRTADVEWLEAARNYVRLHAGERAYLVRTTLAALAARLDPDQFRRASRSALVNVDRVREVQPWFHGDAIVILESGARVTLSRRYRANLLGTPVA
jgi:two-component system LytT family response regulator